MQAVEGEGNCLGWAARDVSGVLSPFKFERRVLRPDDITIQITHAGASRAPWAGWVAAGWLRAWVDE
jgi:cinnamyl-alcohol dehydrogenase